MKKYLEVISIVVVVSSTFFLHASSASATASKLYLLNTTTISHPASIDSASKSTALPVGTDRTGSPGTALDMNTSAGSSQATVTTTTGTSATLISARFHTWVSNNLGGVDIAAQNWTLGLAGLENNAAANQYFAISLYVLKSDGTVRGYIYDSSTLQSTEFTTGEQGRVFTIAGSAVTGVTSTDYLVLEVWTTGTQSGTTSRTITCDWNGTTDPTNGSSASSAAAYIAAATQNIFANASPTVTTQSASSVTTTTATLNGNITATGGVGPTVRGFAWGTNSSLKGGDTATTTDTVGQPFGTGAFTDSSETFVCNKTYYSRAYATNSAGTGLGAISAAFTTAACGTSTSTRTMLLFNGYRIKLIGKRIIIQQKH